MITSESRKTMPVRGPSRITRTVKEAVLDVFNDLQKDEDQIYHLKNFAKLNPKDFYAIAAKLIPTEVHTTLKKVIRVSVDHEQPKTIEDIPFEEINSELKTDFEFLE